MAVMLRAAAVVLCGSFLTACGGSSSDSATTTADSAAGGVRSAQVPVEQLLAQANAALQAGKLFDPPEQNAMALFLQVSEREDASGDDGRGRRRLMESVGAGDSKQQASAAMNDLVPFGVTRVEQALRAGEINDAGRILSMLERAQPGSSSLARLRTAHDAARANARLALRSTEPDLLPALISKSRPRYPARALRQGTSGWVHLAYVINPDGEVGEVKVVDSEPKGVFDSEAVSALKRWRFSAPGREISAEEKMEFDPKEH
jgi:TonB family protein